MKAEELRYASPGFYVIDEGYDLVLNADSPIPIADDAYGEAVRLHKRTGRVYLVRQVLTVADPLPPCAECGRPLGGQLAALYPSRDSLSICLRCQLARGSL